MELALLLLIKEDLIAISI